MYLVIEYLVYSWDADYQLKKSTPIETYDGNIVRVTYVTKDINLSSYNWKDKRIVGTRIRLYKNKPTIIEDYTYITSEELEELEFKEKKK